MIYALMCVPKKEKKLEATNKQAMKIKPQPRSNFEYLVSDKNKRFNDLVFAASFIGDVNTLITSFFFAIISTAVKKNGRSPKS